MLDTGNAFNAASDEDVGLAGNDALRCQRDRLQAGGAKAVHGHAGNSDRAAGTQGDLACNVVARCAFGVGTAHDHVIDFTSLNAGAGNSVLHGMAAQRSAMRHVESALPAFGQRGAGGGNNYC